MKRRVVITGVGPITPSASAKMNFWGNLIAGKSGIGLITQFDASDPGFTTKLQAKLKILISLTMAIKRRQTYGSCDPVCCSGC